MWRVGDVHDARGCAGCRVEPPVPSMVRYTSKQLHRMASVELPAVVLFSDKMAGLSSWPPQRIPFAAQQSLMRKPTRSTSAHGTHQTTRTNTGRVMWGVWRVWRVCQADVHRVAPIHGHEVRTACLQAITGIEHRTMQQRRQRQLQLHSNRHAWHPSLVLPVRVTSTCVRGSLAPLYQGRRFSSLVFPCRPSRLPGECDAARLHGSHAREMMGGVGGRGRRLAHHNHALCGKARYRGLH